MNKKLIFIFALIFLFGVAVIKDFDKDRGFLANLIPFTLIEESTSIVDPCDSYSTNRVLCSGHIEMMKSFVDNLTNGNVKEVVAQIEFPLTFYANGNQIIVLDAPDHFIDKYYHYIFPKHIIKDLQTAFEEDKENLGAVNEIDIYSRRNILRSKEMTFGRGFVWFNMESGKVITINHTDEILIQKMIDEEEAHGFRVYPISTNKEGANSQDNIGQIINGKWRSGTIRSASYCSGGDFDEMGPYTVLIDLPKIDITEDGTTSRTPYKWECRVKKTYKTSLEEASNAENADWGTCGGSWDNLNYFDSISVMELENSSKVRKWVQGTTRGYEEDYDNLGCKNIVVSNNGRRISLLLGTHKLTSEQSLPRQGFVLQRQ
jgi:hypothetical protein